MDKERIAQDVSLQAVYYDMADYDDEPLCKEFSFSRVTIFRGDGYLLVLRHRLLRSASQRLSL